MPDGIRLTSELVPRLTTGIDYFAIVFKASV